MEHALSSSSQSSCTYDVFLSFRGEDTRKAFTDHLYTALTGAGFQTFRDNEGIERGENIKYELDRAIAQSRCSVIVLSQNYSTSTWCLDELTMIVEHKKRDSRHMILPIFYHVDPSDVRKQTGSVGDAFVVHESKKEFKEKVKTWRDALRHVADLGGMPLQNQADGHEAKFIQKVVKVIEERLKRTMLNVPTYLVGIESRVRHVSMWLGDGSTEVGILALCGISGIGKTTIAKYVFNLNFERFDASSFLANIKEVSGLPDGLIRLQTQLVDDISYGKKKKIWNIDEGIIRIRDVLSRKRVLLVLDDIDHIDQFEAIIGMRDSLHPGSKIIITTRHARSLPYGSYKIHDVEEMDFDESVRLFSWYAFGQDYPFDDYADHSRSVVKHCGGLPLALKVLGSSFCGKGVDVWKSALQKLELITDQQIFRKLLICYDSLPDDHDKNLFLEIACFFIGKDKDYTVTILDACGFYTVVGIENLVDRCLITIDSKNNLRMHQMIRDMGREIIRQESPKEPEKRTRLWHYKDSFHVLRENSGTETITGLTLDMKMVVEDNSAMSKCTNNSAKKHFRFGFLPWRSVNQASVDLDSIYLATDAFTRMPELKVLQINYTKLIGSYKDFPKKLKWLCWRGFPYKYVPLDFPLETLVAIDMRYSRLKQIWKGYRFLGSLKILNLSHCHELVSTPNFSSVPQLERLILKDCISLVVVHESIGNLEMKLIELNLKDCRKLRSLPRNICRLKVLETLDIFGCLNLEELPQQMKNMESLRVFSADRIEMNPSSHTTSKEGIWYDFSTRWASIPRKWPKLSLDSLPKSLVSLSLSNCNLNDYSFPMEFNNLKMLKILDLSLNPICSLPDCIRGLTGLQILQLYSCTRLQELIDLPPLSHLLAVRCTSLEKITFQSNVRRESLSFVVRCEKLVELEGCFKLETIRNLDNVVMKSLGMYPYDFNDLNNLEVKMFNIYTKTEHKGPIQGLFEKGIDNIFLPGNKVQGWMSSESVGLSSVSFTVPSAPSSNTRIGGMNVSVVYTLDEKWDLCSIINTIIFNKTKDLKFIYCPTCYGLSKPNQDMMTWLSLWKFHPSQLDVGDQLHISVECNRGFRVNEIGVRVVYKDEQTQSSEDFVSMKLSYRQGTTAVINLGFFEWGYSYLMEMTKNLQACKNKLIGYTSKPSSPKLVNPVAKYMIRKD